MPKHCGPSAGIEDAVQPSCNPFSGPSLWISSRRTTLPRARFLTVAVFVASLLPAPAAAASFPSVVRSILDAQTDGRLAKMGAEQRARMTDCVIATLNGLPNGKKRYIVEGANSKSRSTASARSSTRITRSGSRRSQPLVPGLRSGKVTTTTTTSGRAGGARFSGWMSVIMRRRASPPPNLRARCRPI